MKRNTIHVASLILFLAASTAYAVMPEGKYLEGKDSKIAVILAHGQGLDPDSQVVGPLRKAIHKELGYHTLSLQMPVVPGKRSRETFLSYASTFPDAYKRIQTACPRSLAGALGRFFMPTMAIDSGGLRRSMLVV